MLNPASISLVKSSHDNSLACSHVFKVNSTDSRLDSLSINIVCKIAPQNFKRETIKVPASAAHLDKISKIDKDSTETTRITARELNLFKSHEFPEGEDQTQIDKKVVFYRSIADDFEQLLPSLIDNAESQHADYAKLIVLYL